MAGLVEKVEAWRDGLKALTGQQAYFLDVRGSPSAAVVSFEAIETLGDPYQVTVRLTHPEELDRAEYLNRDAIFRIVPPDGSEGREFSGCITRFSKTAETRDFCAYEIVVEPHVVRLRLTRSTGVEAMTERA